MVPQLLKCLIASLGLALATVPAGAQTAKDQAPVPGIPPTIAIIIDDMGHDLVQGKRLVDLEQPLTLAFLPYRRHTTALAEAAYRQGKEIMLHAPMANTRQFGLGPGGLEVTMDQPAIASTLRRALMSIPHVKGVNNHMGSQLTQMQANMNWVMSELVNYPVYFVDSRTIASSVAGDTAAAHRIPTLTRDVFLDHEQTEEYVDRQFKLLVRKAREHGSAIGIGHPHKVTVDYLAKVLPTLDEQGIAVATVSAVWTLRNNNREMFAPNDRRPVAPALAERKRESEAAR